MARRFHDGRRHGASANRNTLGSATIDGQAVGDQRCKRGPVLAYYPKSARFDHGMGRRCQLLSRIPGCSDRAVHPQAAARNSGVEKIQCRGPGQLGGAGFSWPWSCLRAQSPTHRNALWLETATILPAIAGADVVLRKLATPASNLAGHRLSRVHASLASVSQQLARTAVAIDCGVK